ncbi:Uncharacterised protein [Vibrio cholerae]|nr:Uncharacterised protein [Vibrio cholerae]
MRAEKSASEMPCSATIVHATPAKAKPTLG